MIANFLSYVLSVYTAVGNLLPAPALSEPIAYLLKMILLLSASGTCSGRATGSARRTCIKGQSVGRARGDVQLTLRALRWRIGNRGVNIRCGGGSPQGGASVGKPHLSAKCLECLAGLLVGLGSAICYSFFCEFLHSLFYKIFLLPILSARVFCVGLRAI